MLRRGTRDVAEFKTLLRVSNILRNVTWGRPPLFKMRLSPVGHLTRVSVIAGSNLIQHTFY